MDEVIDAVLALFTAESTINSLYKKKYYGMNNIPGEHELPCIEVYPIDTSMINKGTGSMMNTYVVGVNIKDTVKASITEDTDKETVAHVKTFVQRIENRDSNGKPESATILGVLHDNRKLSNTAHIHEVSKVTYNFGPGTTKDTNIVTASVKITVKRISPRS